MQGAAAVACFAGILLWALLSVQQWHRGRPLLGPLAGVQR